MRSEGCLFPPLCKGREGWGRANLQGVEFALLVRASRFARMTNGACCAEGGELGNIKEAVEIINECVNTYSARV